jgi:ATP-dependent Clp protease adaptor protein ClpS
METTTTSIPVLETQTKRKFGPRWRVVGLNDDVTPMDYVVMVLIDLFHKEIENAYQLMMEVHETGSATFYLGTREACELKLEQVQQCNQRHGESLGVSMESIEEG